MTEVEKFQAWVTDQVENNGLLGISGVNFDRGGTALDVLQAKANETYFYQNIIEGTQLEMPTLEQIAKSMNDAEAAVARGDYEVMEFEDSTRLKPSGEPLEITKQILRDLSK